MSDRHWYHGSGTRIEFFDESFLGLGVEQMGSGFYFTDSFDEAVGYCLHRNLSGDEKPGGEDCPSVMQVEFDFDVDTDLLRWDDKVELTQDQARAILAKGLRQTQDREAFTMMLENFGEMALNGEEALLTMAAGSYAHHGHMLRSLFCMANDFFAGEEGLFCRLTKEVTGYAGAYKEPDKAGYPTHVIAWDRNDVHITRIHDLSPEREAISEETPRPGM